MRVAEAIERFGGSCEGDPTVEITRLTGVDLVGPGDTTYATEEKHLAAAEARGAACVIVPPHLRASRLTLLRCSSPQCLVADLLHLLHPQAQATPGIHPSAVIGAGTTIDPTACIGPHVVVGTDCTIAARVRLDAGVVIGDQCVVGAETVIYPRVSIYARSRIGARVVIHAGAVISADGFGYFFEAGRLHKWPHVGKVVIDDDVEIGADACIDRARFGATLIERGAKLDNLVQIGHNCRVGPGALLAGQTGLAGSVVIEAGAVCGGQVGIADHNTIGAGARIGAQSGIMRHVPPGAEWLGYPAKPVRQCVEEVNLLAYLNDKRAVLRRMIRAAGAAPPPAPADSAGGPAESEPRQ